MPASALAKHTGASTPGVTGATTHLRPIQPPAPSAAPAWRFVPPGVVRPSRLQAHPTSAPAMTSMALLTPSRDAKDDAAGVLERTVPSNRPSQQQPQQRRPRRFVGDACPLAGEFHSSDFDWHEHAAACAPLLRAQEEQAALAAAGITAAMPDDGVHSAGGVSSISSDGSSSDSSSRDHQAVQPSTTNRSPHSTNAATSVPQPSSTSPGIMPSTSTTASTSTSTSNRPVPSHPDDAKWEVFYRQHPRARFFKQRRYLLLEFPALQTARHIIELGCGCGSSLLPVLTANMNSRATAFDVSATSVQQLLDAATAAGMDAHRIDAFVADAADPSLADGRLASVGADAALIMYTLSAVMPDRMVLMLRNAYAALEPGGVLMLRDHGLYDMVQLRIPAHQRLGANLYRREDGTLAYFFTTQELSALAEAAGFSVLECSYICVINYNRRTGQKLRRVFVHGVFQRLHKFECHST